MILHLETSTKVCSVALSKEGALIDFLEHSEEQFVHGEQLTLMIEQLMRANNVSWPTLKALSIAIGPGSYTGLRIGLATAKGICFALNLPLIAVSSLQSLIAMARIDFPNETIAAAFDARRDEVFLRVESQYDTLIEDRPEILSSSNFNVDTSWIWVGDANTKVKHLFPNNNWRFEEAITPSSQGQVQIAFERYKAKDFQDLYSLTPNYTKAFYTTGKV
jgi:tRNA threonylcarbamoyladenosine biosynthesis protein TsaB